MTSLYSLAAFLLLLFFTAGVSLAQDTEKLPLSARNVRGVLVPAGSPSVLIPLVTDPGPDGGDLFDTLCSDPAARIGLILPNGTEINDTNAQAMGFFYTVIVDGSLTNSQFASSLSMRGTHTLISLPPASPPGTYQIKIDGSAVTQDAVALSTYFSSSTVQAALITGQAQYKVGETVVVSGLVYDSSNPITQATVTVEINDAARPELAPVEITLQDSGPYDFEVGDGIYTGTFVPDHAASYVLTMEATGLSLSGVSFCRLTDSGVQVSPLLASFVSFQDAAVNNANGFIDSISVTTTLNVLIAGDYKFSASLATTAGGRITNSIETHLDAGSQQMAISFPADTVYGLGADGPYQIKDAMLISQQDDSETMADYRAEAGNTAAYQLSALNTSSAPDLTVTNLGAPSPVQVGQQLTYSSTVYNLGPNTATGVTFIDQLPAGVSLVSVTASQGACSGTSLITCSLGDVPAGESALVSIVVTPLSVADLINTTNVANSTREFDLSNNSTTLTTTVAPSPAATAEFVATDGTSQGNWQGRYGSEGYNVINNTENYPDYADVLDINDHPYTFTNLTTDIRGLQKAFGTDRIVAGWYSNSSFTVDLNLRDGLAHRIALYVMDWDLNSKSERIDILDASSNAVLNSQTVTNYTHGKYLIWTVRGHVKIKMTNLGPFNGVINGLFFDPENTPPPPIPNYSISGIVADSSGNPLNGATLTLGGYSSATTTTGPDGSYAFPSLPAGQDYTVTPSGPIAPFTPTSRALTYLSGNITADFTGTPALLANGKLAYTDGSSVEKLYVLNGNGSGRRSICAPSGKCQTPAWSPDGTRFAFVSTVFVNGGGTRKRVSVMNVDGGNVRLLTYTFSSFENYDSPAWSPDGTKIAFRSDREGGQYKLYVMNANGNNITKLSDDWIQETPSWSPDSTKLVFSAYLNNQQSLITISPDGTGRTVITNSVDLHPVWSPNGLKIAFVSVRDSNAEIYVVDPNGANALRLTNNAADDLTPAWSPDSTKLAFVRNLNFSNQEIFVTSADGSNQINITNNPANDFDPAWSPDGTQIAFTSWRAIPGIYVMNPDGTAQTNLAVNGYKPIWQPAPTALPPPPLTYSIRVHVTTQTGSEWSDIPVTVSGTENGTKSNAIDSTGILFWDLPAGGNYTFIPPPRSNYVFTPPSQTFNNLSSDQTTTFIMAPPPPTPTPTPPPTPTPTPTPSADLFTYTSASTPSYVPSGGPVNITVSLLNNGPFQAVNATLTGQLPVGVTFDSAVSNDGSPCVGTPGSASFVCTFPTVDSGETKTVAVTVTATGAPYTLHTLTFTVASDTFDNNQDFNTSSAQFFIASPPLPTPTPGPADELQLAYTKFDNATFQGDIFRQRADAAELLNLTNSATDESGFTWSPDGSKIVFVRLDFANQTASSYVMAADGSNLVQLTSVPGEYISAINWSPDSSKLLFSAFSYSNDSTESQIYVINADGTGRANVSGTDGFNTDASWSPDGTKISFVRGHYFGDFNPPTNDLYVANADGTNPIQIAHAAGERDFGPVWSPDGTRLAFTRILPDGAIQVYTMRPDGSEQQPIVIAPDTQTFTPQWAPDGRLSFSSLNYTTFASAIEAANYDGSRRVTLYSAPQGGAYYGLNGWTWAPDGSRLALSYVIGEAFGSNVCIVNGDGTGLQCVGISDQEYNGSPDWSPDSARLAFVSNRNGERSIDLVNADGTGRVELTRADVFSAKWRPRQQGNTPVGPSVTVTQNGATVTFSNVAGAGNTIITPIDPNSLSGVPGEYVINANSLAFEITTTAAYIGPITIDFQVPGVNNPITFSTLRVLHGEPPPVPNFVDRTVLAPDSPTHDFPARTIYARVTSLSPFIVLERRDTTAPVTTATLSTPANAAGWHKTNPTVTLSATDNAGGSGVHSITSSATGAQSTAQTTAAGSTAAITFTTEGTTTLTYHATDAQGNVEAAKSLIIKLDKTTPSITITKPAAIDYLLNQSVTAGFQCTDSGSGAAACTGPVANNAALSLTSVGAKTFTVNATDVAGNTSQQTVNYQVTFGINPLFDQKKSHKSGSTIPIKLELVDASGVNRSASSIIVTATAVTRLSDMAPGVLQDPGDANPDSNFRFTGGNYHFNLKTTGYATGTYRLDFQVSGDPVTHSVQFQIK